jgi:hypothetical protein
VLKQRIKTMEARADAFRIARREEMHVWINTRPREERIEILRLLLRRWVDNGTLSTDMLDDPIASGAAEYTQAAHKREYERGGMKYLRMMADEEYRIMAAYREGKQAQNIDGNRR